MSRNRTVERRKEREQQRKRQRQTGILIGVVAIAVVAVLLLVLKNQPAEATIPAESIARYDGIPQSQTDEGFPQLGAETAPVKVIEYSSFDCPHCMEFHDQVMPTVIDRVRAGEVQFTYIPLYNWGSITNGQGAARAAVCVAQQGQFWPFHDALFVWQGAYANTAFSDARLQTGISNLTIDRAQWDQCMGNGTADQILNAALRASQLQNISGTPTVVVNGTVLQNVDINTVNTAISSALASSSQPVTPITEATQEATSEATLEVTQEAVQEATAEATAP
jgi:protein-disulfide isomerase